MRDMPLRIVVVGHVDHGKSTLIGRLMHDTGSLPAGAIEILKDVSARRGAGDVEWSFLLDSFQAERDQAITIDVTEIHLKTPGRATVIIDAPGHRTFIRNMVTGAAAADAAILVVDAVDGVQEQTRRHAWLLRMLGLSQVIVAVNKMDMAEFDQERFFTVMQDVRSLLREIGMEAAHIIPVSARHGDMVAARGDRMAWYDGPDIVAALSGFETMMQPSAMPLRFAVQDVYYRDDRRIVVGRVETGVLRQGDRLIFSPRGEQAGVKSLCVWPDDPSMVEAHAGAAVGIVLDDDVFIERGDMASHDRNMPMLTNVFRMRVFWLDELLLRAGDSCVARIGLRDVAVTVQSVNHVTDTVTMEDIGTPEIAINMAGDVTLRARDVLAIDPYDAIPATGRVVLARGGRVAGIGLASMDGYADQRRRAQPVSQNLQRVGHLVDAAARAQRNGWRGGVFWLTGLSASGKSTLAMLAERALFAEGAPVYVVDGDNLRHGLNADLGFSPEDRAENVRRAGAVAALMADAGMICISAFISPYRADRARARESAGARFHEIYIRADLETCEARDPKGLYKKARRGEIAAFTGIDSPYEAPDHPDIVIDTQASDVDTCLRQLVDYITLHSRTGAAHESKTERKRES